MTEQLGDAALFASPTDPDAVGAQIVALETGPSPLALGGWATSGEKHLS
jgi:hypothetical protein